MGIVVLPGTWIGSPTWSATVRAIRTSSPNPTSANNRSPRRLAGVASVGSHVSGVSSKTRSIRCRSPAISTKYRANMRASVRPGGCVPQGRRSRSRRDRRPHRGGGRVHRLWCKNPKEKDKKRPIGWSIAAAAIGIVLVATACTASSGSPSAATVDAASASTYAVSLSDELKITPAMIDAPASTPLTFTVTIDGKGQHSFAVQAPGQTYETAMLDGGATATLDVPGLAAGSYTYLCTVPGHADAGMKGMLMVADGAGTVQAAGATTGSSASPMAS